MLWIAGFIVLSVLFVPSAAISEVDRLRLFDYKGLSWPPAPRADESDAYLEYVRKRESDVGLSYFNNQSDVCITLALTISITFIDNENSWV
jgi:hypothetical protein